jgi:hypothetical protein
MHSVMDTVVYRRRTEDRENIPLDPPSKGEFCVTIVIGIYAVTRYEPEAISFFNTTRSVVRHSPFEGGSRGMLSRPSGALEKCP